MTHEPKTFPDVFVIGAQKAGTTSLCLLLEHVKGVCMARPKEPMILSRDDINVHPHYFAEQPDAWATLDWDEKNHEFVQSYARCFMHADANDIAIDGSTSYLISKTVPERIQQHNSKAKIVVLLRDPASRAYSAYWHYVRSGTVCEPFDKHLQYESGHTIHFGHYQEHLTRWMKYFPREQFHFVCYEDMIAHPEKTVTTLCEFLGIEAPENISMPNENVGITPKRLWIHLALNMIDRRLGRNHAAIAQDEERVKRVAEFLLDPIREWNETQDKYPPMDQQLHANLDRYFQRLNRDVASMTGLELEPYWYKAIR